MMTYTDTYLRLLKLYKDTGAGHIGGAFQFFPLFMCYLMGYLKQIEIP